MEHTTCEHPFPCSIIQPPSKASVISITVECLNDKKLFRTSRDVEQHICYDHQTVKSKIVWKCHHCDKHFDSDRKIRDHLDFLKNSITAKTSESVSLFPMVDTVLPNKMLLKLATRDDAYNSLLNADSEELFHFGFEASLLKKRLFLEREPSFWERDYVKFQDIPHKLQQLPDDAMDIQPASCASWSENVPIAITADTEMKRISKDKWQAMSTQIQMNNKIIEGVTNTMHFQCGLLQSVPSDQLTASEHHHLERLLHARDIPPEFRQLHKAGTKEVGRRLDDFILGTKRKY